MRERALDEFESIFERAAIPVLDIAALTLARLSVVLKGDALDATALAIAVYLRDRFGATVRLHWPDGVSVTEAQRAAKSHGLPIEGDAFHSTAELIGQIGLARTQLIIVPEPDDIERRIIDKDDLVRGAAPPVLIVRRPLADPSRAFSRILHSLTGNFQQTQNFSYSFGLVAEGGSILLLHTIEAADIEGVRDALKVSKQVDDAGGDELIERMRHHGERYLRGVVAASRQHPCDVDYRLEVGEVVPLVQAELAAGGYGMLVVGRHEEGFSRISAADYQLMHLVRDVLVLAL